MAKREIKTYSVSQLNTLIKCVLEDSLPSRLQVSGEVTDFKLHQSGHCYFSLKDEDAQLPCVMWASKFRKLKFKLANGQAVIARGNVDVYVPGGKYQMYVDRLEPAGVGALQFAFEQMVQKLTLEGLFDEEYNRPLPAYPERIGVLTSATGAAFADIADSIFNRWPAVELVLYPVAVQGDGAAEEIAAAIGDVNRRNKKLKLDLLIVGRGGGSLEDLWAFNEEVLARAIFASEIPIISAVGHEIDVTIADLVADARASTPTKAGVIAVPDAAEVLGELAAAQRRMSSNMRSKIELCRGRVDTVMASAVFKSPVSIVAGGRQRLDEVQTLLVEGLRERVTSLRQRVQYYFEKVIKIEPHRVLARDEIRLNKLQSSAEAGLNKILNRSRLTLTAAVNRLEGVSPNRVVAQKKMRLNALEASAEAGVHKIFNGSRLKLTAAVNRLEGMNPKSVLGRGYSITTNSRTGKIVTKAGDVAAGDVMTTELADENLVESEVIKMQNKKVK